MSIEEINEAFDREYDKYKNSPEYKAFAEQEPVAWVDKVWVERLDIAKQLRIELLFSRCQLSHNQIPLYTAPPRKEWQAVNGKLEVEPIKGTLLPQAGKQEPVDIHCPSCLHPFAVVPVAEREWVGLTGEELAQLTLDHLGYPTRLTAAIESQLKEKNNG